MKLNENTARCLLFVIERECSDSIAKHQLEIRSVLKVM